ncbi:MAG: Lpg1974 family pore-forming outer membrane protein [Planctomycetota bacterium]
MRRYLAAGAALIACLAAAGVSRAQADQERLQKSQSEIQAVFDEFEKASASMKRAAGSPVDALGPAASGGVELASCNNCGPVNLDLGGMSNGCTGQFYVGAEYLYVRPTFSQAISFVTVDNTAPLDPVITYNNFDFDHNSNFRVYGGYRVCECGCDIRFAYSNMGGDSSFVTDTVDATMGVTFFAPLEVFADTEGTFIEGSADVDLDTFDLDFAKTIPLGCPLGCCSDGCSDCCDPCGCWCPAWDITWHGGFRAIDYDSTFIYDDFRPDVGSVAGTTLDQTSVARTSFSGAGLRTGMTGRRYFGRSGFASVFLRGDISLLLGDLDIVAESIDGNRFATHRFSNTQIIPVTEIEAGGTVLITCNLSVSAGYMLAAYHDLGYRVEYPYDATATGVQIDNFDDANILGWDGFFLRAEATF